MEIIPRKTAKLHSLKNYFTGIPCRHGHICERSVANWTCRECLRIKKLETRYDERTREAVLACQRKSNAKLRQRLLASPDAYDKWKAAARKAAFDRYHGRDHKKLKEYGRISMQNRMENPEIRKRKIEQNKCYVKNIKNNPIKYSKKLQEERLRYNQRLEQLKTNPEEYKKFLESRRSKGNARYERIKASPEKLEALHEYYKKRYGRIKASPEKLEELQEYSQERYDQIKQDVESLEKLRASARKRAKKERATIRGKLDYNLRQDIWTSLKNKKAGKHWENLVGWTIDNLIDHLQEKFNEKMTWENYGSYWEIDHIKPKSWFKYENTGDDGFKECWSLKNLQPLEKTLNRQKSNKHKLSRWDIIEKIGNLSQTHD